MAKSEPLVGGNFYHVYNRGNNGETIFHDTENYRYFMGLFIQHVEPIGATYAFCLLPNHFHFLEYVRTDNEQRAWQLAQGCQLSDNWQPSPPHRALKNLFIAYTMAFNKRYARTGSLFQKPFKRKRVDSDRYFVALVRYIHRNPQKHGLIDDFRSWRWSSYRTMLSEKPTSMPRGEVLGWFGGRDNFETAHRTSGDEDSIGSLILE